MQVNEAKVKGQVRHWVGLVGGALIGFGIANQGEVGSLVDLADEAVGVALSLWALYQSWRAREKQDA